MAFILYVLVTNFINLFNLYEGWKYSIVDLNNFNSNRENFLYYIDRTNVNLFYKDFLFQLFVFIVTVLSASFLFFLNLLPDKNATHESNDAFIMTDYEKVCLVIFWIIFVYNLCSFYFSTWFFIPMYDKATFFLTFIVMALFPFLFLYSLKKSSKMNLTQMFILLLGVLMSIEFISFIPSLKLNLIITYFLFSFIIIFFLFPLSPLSKWFEKRYFKISEETRLVFTMLITFLGISINNINLQDTTFSSFFFTLAFLVVFPYIFRFATLFFNMKSDYKSKIVFILSGIAIYYTIFTQLEEYINFQSLQRIVSAENQLILNYEHVPNILTSELSLILANNKFSPEDTKTIENAYNSYSRIQSRIENLIIPLCEDLEIMQMLEEEHKKIKESYLLRMEAVKNLKLYLQGQGLNENYIIEAKHMWEIAKIKREEAYSLLTKINIKLKQKERKSKSSMFPKLTK